jgi:hypothetical protein
MKNLYQYIDELKSYEWQYYIGINNSIETKKPFVDHSDYSSFILNYFRKGGKVKIFELCNINLNQIRLPNHICSVFFLGIILYNKTEFSKKYQLPKSDAEYATFPFIWFLIALFHDNAYHMEDENQLQDVSSISQLINKFNIKHSLFDRKFSKCNNLLNSRNNYFLFRKLDRNVVDHGILGGLLLFDRLVKIRREKKKIDEDTLFWGRKLENQYKIAANAISIHNIWLQPPEICRQHKLEELIDFKPIKFKEFPMFYILGIIDTIEPLKTYQDDNVSDIDILKSLEMEFGKCFLRVRESKNSKIDFKKLIDKTKNFKNWLDVDVKSGITEFELIFH